MIRLIILLLALLSVGCTQSSRASMEMDEEAKQFHAHPDFATLYVYREEDWYGAALVARINLDGKGVGYLRNGYFCILVPEGSHVLTTFLEDYLIETELDMKKGSLTFVEVKPMFNSNLAKVVSAPEQVQEKIIPLSRLKVGIALSDQFQPGRKTLHVPLIIVLPHSP